MKKKPSPTGNAHKKPKNAPLALVAATLPRGAAECPLASPCNCAPERGWRALNRTCVETCNVTTQECVDTCNTCNASMPSTCLHKLRRARAAPEPVPAPASR